MIQHPDQLTWQPALPACTALCLCGHIGTATACSETRRPDLLGRTDADFAAAVSEVGGLHLDLTRSTNQAIPNLPRFIPQVDGSAITSSLVRPTVAVAFGVLRKRAGAVPRSDRTLAERLGVAPTTKVGLLLFAKDPILEDLWHRRHLWIDTIRRWQPAFVVAPDFSIWEGDPALGALYNLVRSTRVYGDLQRVGVPAIPHLLWGNRRQLDAWIAWLVDNHVPVISMDLQCRGRAQFNRLLADLNYLREHLAPIPRLLASGIAPSRDLVRLMEVWPDVAVTRNQLAEVANHVELVRRPDGSFRRASSDLDPAILFAARVEETELWLDERFSMRQQTAA